MSGRYTDWRRVLVAPAALSRDLQPQRKDYKQLLKDKVFEVGPILSHEECRYYVSSTESVGYAGIEWEYSPEYRNCKRLVVKCAELANTLWERIKPHLRREDIADVRPFGFGAEGVWQPYGINECIRFTRYDANCFFKPHRDGSFVLTDDDRSIYTIMVYLNDGFGGGKTEFYSTDNDNEPFSISITPREGFALIFTHDALHEGKPPSDTKYILRTDIMFRRIAYTPIVPQPRTRTLSSSARGSPSTSPHTSPPTAIGKNAYESDPLYRAAEELYQQSIKKQREGDPVASTEAYLKALELQAALRSLCATFQPGPELRWLPRDLFFLIFSMLPLPSLLQLAQVTRAFKILARDNEFWRRKCREQWPERFAFECSTASAESESLPQHLHNWFLSYKHHYLITKRFPVIIVDVGTAFTKAATLGSDRIFTVESVIAQKQGHYWSSGSGLDFYYVGRKAIESSRWKNSEEQPITSEGVLPEAILVLATEALSHLTKHYETWHSHPLLLIQSGTLSDKDMARVIALMDNKCQVPCATVLDVGVAALASVNRVTGVVLSVGVGVTEVVPVVQGNVVKQARQIVRDIIGNEELSPSDVETNMRTWFSNDGTQRSVVRCVVDAIAACPAEVQPQLWRNVMLTGGLCTQLRERFEKELRLHATSVGITDFGIIRPDSPPYLDAIYGARLWAALPQSQKQFIPREIRNFDFLRPFTIRINPSYLYGITIRSPVINFDAVSDFSLWLEFHQHRLPKNCQYRIVICPSDSSSVNQLITTLNLLSQTPPIFVALRGPAVPAAKYQGKIVVRPKVKHNDEIVAKFANWEPLSQFF